MDFIERIQYSFRTMEFWEDDNMFVYSMECLC